MEELEQLKVDFVYVCVHSAAVEPVCQSRYAGDPTVGHGSPFGDRKVKETMYRMASRILEEIEQWRENSSTDDTLNSLPSIVTFLKETKEMNFAILREEDEAATEFPSILKLLIKKLN